jgi:hypothetical protein
VSGTEQTCSRWLTITAHLWLLSVTESSVTLPPHPVSNVSDQHPISPLERPRCARCQTRMMLERTSPGPIGFEHRVFECPKCNHVETRVIASDPFNSKAAGWLSGELGRAVTHDVKDGKLVPKSAK